MCIRDRMQALQPKITELKEKLKDDPQKMNKETMKLYSTYGINPAGGCLPMLLHCLLYTSDAADERSSVDLGGRRIIKNKTKKTKQKSKKKKKKTI